MQVKQDVAGYPVAMPDGECGKLDGFCPNHGWQGTSDIELESIPIAVVAQVLRKQYETHRRLLAYFAEQNEGPNLWDTSARVTLRHIARELGIEL